VWYNGVSSPHLNERLFSMLNDNVVPFKSQPRKVTLTQEQLDYLEDMCLDLDLTFDNIEEQFSQSEFAHGMIVILFDSEGQVYVDAMATPKIAKQIQRMSKWMEAFNDLHDGGPGTQEIPE